MEPEQQSDQNGEEVIIHEKRQYHVVKWAMAVLIVALLGGLTHFMWQFAMQPDPKPVTEEPAPPPPPEPEPVSEAELQARLDALRGDGGATTSPVSRDELRNRLDALNGDPEVDPDPLSEPVSEAELQARLEALSSS